MLVLALAQAQDVLTEVRWRSASIGAVIKGALAPHRSGHDRIDASGPEIWIDAKRVLALTLALHELATNATKYGALSNESGNVRITWDAMQTADGRPLHFRWTEQGGPQVTPPARRGFGSRLMETNLASEFDGEVVIEHDPAGLVCIIDAPLTAQLDARSAARGRSLP